MVHSTFINGRFRGICTPASLTRFHFPVGVSDPLSSSHEVKEASGSLKRPMEVIGVAPALSILELSILFDLPTALPLPLTLNRQENAIFGQFNRALLVTPCSSLMRKKYLLENSHPDPLILISFKLPHLFIFLPSVMGLWNTEYGIRPILFSFIFLPRLRIIKLIIRAIIMDCSKSLMKNLNY